LIYFFTHNGSAVIENKIMVKAKRKKNPKVHIDVLVKSRRRCCLCFGLKGDHGEKRGQIAHLDHNRINDKIDNLAFLCFDHHDQYDSITSQSKSIQINELKTYREQLYQFVESGGFHDSGLPGESEKKEWSKFLSVSAFNAWLSERPHECSFCGYFFSIMPDLEKGKSYYVKAATCPKCGNQDEVFKFYHG
jgi:hypothetical protein